MSVDIEKEERQAQMDPLHLVMAVMDKKGFITRVFDSAESTKSAVLSLIGDGTVGFGGSMTLDNMGIYEELKSGGNTVFWHWKQDEDAREHSLNTDFYLTSTNALTSQGELVNIDGRGNRVATMLLAKKLIIIVGQNKIVEGGIQEGISRAKKCACPPNAKRLGARTPCAKTLDCVDCDSVDRICRVTSIIDRPMIGGQKIYVFLVREDLGY